MSDIIQHTLQAHPSNVLVEENDMDASDVETERPSLRQTNHPIS